jgi:Xaa-Pro aminopeptidase
MHLETNNLPRLDVPKRMPRLRERLGSKELDGLLVSELTNVRYLTGFTGSAALLLVTPDAALLVTDGRYRTQAAEELDSAGVEGVELFVGRVDGQREAISKLAHGRLGLEAEHVAWAQELRWAELLKETELVATSGVVEELRIVKDEGEVARIRAAAALALDVAMRRLGAEDRAFETIVASGPNSAKPHAQPGARKIKARDPVVIDFGAVVDGYRSDMTRTFFVGGSSSPRMTEIYAAVLEAQASGVSAVAAGVTGGHIDDVCRQSLTAAGLGEAFEHGTGHGVGLDIHEAPSVGHGSAGILPAGTIVTVEPGAYLAGFGGVRIEDTLVVTEDGSRVLTSFSKDFSVPLASLA